MLQHSPLSGCSATQCKPARGAVNVSGLPQSPRRSVRLAVALVPGQGIPGRVAPGGAAAPGGPARACESRAPPTVGVRARVRALVHAQHAAPRQCMLSARARAQSAQPANISRVSGRQPAFPATHVSGSAVSSTSVGDREGLCSDGALRGHQPGRRSPGRSVRGVGAPEPMEKCSGNTTRLYITPR
jgi:hypothetical protein